MSESGFYTAAMQGLPGLIDLWLSLGEASVTRLGIILADTARVAKLGDPASDPDSEVLKAWRTGQVVPPLWAAKAAVFLLKQMPARPVPRDDNEAAAWAYVWLRLHAFDSRQAACKALPAHLQSTLGAAMIERAWQDQNAQQLIRG